jgi:hypothetical protein
MSDDINDIQRRWYGGKPPSPAWGTREFVESEVRNVVERYGTVAIGNGIMLSRGEKKSPGWYDKGEVKP